MNLIYICQSTVLVCSHLSSSVFQTNNSNNYKHKFEVLQRLRQFYFDSFSTLSDSFTCFLLIPHLKSLFYFLPAEFSDFSFDTFLEILHKPIWPLILGPCPIFRYLIHFRARSKIFLQYFYLSPIFFNGPKFQTIWWIVVLLQKLVFSALYHCRDQFFIMVCC